jgi:hypothetical protein
MNLRALALSAVLLLLASCASEELQKRIDRVFEIQREANYEEGKRTPWGVGQWALFRMTSTGGETILRVFGGGSRGYERLAVTKKEGSAFWLEVQKVWEDEDRRFALLIDGARPDRMRGLRLLKVMILESDGEVITVEGDEIGGSAASEYRTMVTSFAGAMDLVGGTGRVRKVTVPAGTFQRAYVVPVSVALQAGYQAGHIWFTNIVPIVYQAKYFSRNSSWIWGESTIQYELVDFGFDGAQSFFFGGDAAGRESPAETRGEES